MKTTIAVVAVAIVALALIPVLAAAGTVGAQPPPSPPEICRDPNHFNFAATEGEASPPDQMLGIWNCGDGTLDWSVSDDATWLTLDPPSGSSTGETHYVTLSVNITGVSAGSYNATITIEAPGASNSPQTASVTLIIEPPPSPPEICRDPNHFNFAATEGEANPPDQMLGIWNCGDGTLDWSVSDDATWLTLDPQSDCSTGETDYVTLSVDITGVSAGSYNATITIEDPEATNSPQTASVSLIMPEEEERAVVSGKMVGQDGVFEPSDMFAPSDDLYIIGSGFTFCQDYRIWIQPYEEGAHVAPGDPIIPEDCPSGFVPIVIRIHNGDGTFGPIWIWQVPEDKELICTYWEIVVDKMGAGHEEGIYNPDEDGLDAVALEEAGFHIIPEALTIILLSVGLACLGGYFVLRSRKGTETNA